MDSIRINTNISEDMLKIPNADYMKNMTKSVSDSLVRISKLMAESMKMSSYEYGELAARIGESLKGMSHIYTQYDLSAVRENIAGSLSQISKMYLCYERESMTDMLNMLSETAAHLQSLQLKQIASIDFGRLAEDYAYYMERCREAAAIAYQYVNDEKSDSEEITLEALQQTYEEQITEKEGWQERLGRKSKEFHEKYYVFAKIIDWLIWVLGVMLAYFIEQGVAYAVGNVREEPEKAAPVIYNFHEETEVNIIYEVPYYYYIIYTDGDGCECIGCCPKRNVKIVPGDAEQEENEGE